MDGHVESPIRALVVHIFEDELDALESPLVDPRSFVAEALVVSEPNAVTDHADG
jgi:hypothetical protein